MSRKSKGEDSYHLFYPRSKCAGAAKKFRRHKYCIIKIPKGLHESIHRELPEGITLLDEETFKKVLAIICCSLKEASISLEDPPAKRIDNIIKFLSNYEGCDSQTPHLIEFLEKQKTILAS